LEARSTRLEMLKLPDTKRGFVLPPRHWLARSRLLARLTESAQ